MDLGIRGGAARSPGSATSPWAPARSTGSSVPPSTPGTGASSERPTFTWISPWGRTTLRWRPWGTIASGPPLPGGSERALPPSVLFEDVEIPARGCLLPGRFIFKRTAAEKVAQMHGVSPGDDFAAKPACSCSGSPLCFIWFGIRHGTGSPLPPDPRDQQDEEGDAQGSDDQRRRGQIQLVG